MRGTPDWDVKDINAPIGIDEDSEVRLRRRVIDGGQHSHTTATVLQRMKNTRLWSVLCIQVEPINSAYGAYRHPLLVTVVWKSRLGFLRLLTTP